MSKSLITHLGEAIDRYHTERRAKESEQVSRGSSWLYWLGRQMVPNITLNNPSETSTALPPVHISVHKGTPPVGASYSRNSIFCLPVMGVPPLSARRSW